MTLPEFSKSAVVRQFGAPIGKLEKVDVTDTEDGTNAQGKPTKPIKVTEHIGEFQLYQHGVIAVHKEVNKLAFGVHGPIFPLSKWGPGSALGWPTGDSQEIKKNGKSVGWSSAFESQSLYLSAGASAAITLSDPIRRKYEDLGGPAGWLGFPLGGKKATPDGTFAMRLAEVTKIVGELRNVLTDLTVAPGDEAALRERCEELLVKAKLKPAEIMTTFLKPFNS